MHYLLNSLKGIEENIKDKEIFPNSFNKDITIPETKSQLNCKKESYRQITSDSYAKFKNAFLKMILQNIMDSNK